MAKPKIQIGNELREMNVKEFEQWQTDNLEAEALKEAEKTKIETRENALNKLGLTEDEIKALFG